MLTPSDIESKMFRKVKFGGYNVDEVEEFLEQIIIDYEMLYKQNMEWKDRCDSMQESIAYYKSLEDGINQTVSNATDEAEKMLDNAISEVEYIKNNQEAIVKEKLTELNRELAEKEIRFENLKKQMEIYRIKITSMVEAQMKILKVTEDEEE